jgi:hypothetical protein
MGLVALVPSDDLSTLSVIVPSDHGHLPVFIWDPENSTDLGDGDKIKKELYLHTAPNGYLLRGHQIGHTDEGRQGLHFFTAQPQHQQSHRRMTADMPTARNKADFSWILSMQTLTDGLGFIAPRYYSGEDPAVVAGRLQLTRGVVKTYSFGDVHDQVRALRFVSVGKRPFFSARQAVADVAVVEVTFSDEEWKNMKEEITFSGLRLGDGYREWKVTLHVDEQNDDGNIDVLIGDLIPPLCRLDVEGDEGIHKPALHYDHYLSMLALGASYEDRLLPTLGEARMAPGSINPLPLPEVLSVVSRKKDCLLAGGIARPICMLATFQAPEPDPPPEK